MPSRLSARRATRVPSHPTSESVLEAPVPPSTCVPSLVVLIENAPERQKRRIPVSSPWRGALYNEAGLTNPNPDCKPLEPVAVDWSAFVPDGSANSARLNTLKNCIRSSKFNDSWIPKIRPKLIDS